MVRFLLLEGRVRCQTTRLIASAASHCKGLPSRRKLIRVIDLHIGGITAKFSIVERRLADIPEHTDSEVQYRETKVEMWLKPR